MRGLAFLESIVKPMAWEELSPQARTRSETIRTPGTGTAGHHAPEDRPEEIAAAVSAWADRHGLSCP